MLLILSFFGVSIWLNYGFIKDSSDKIVSLPRIFPQGSLHRAQAINWINNNGIDEEIIFSLLYEDTVTNGINLKFHQYFQNEVIYIPIKNPDDKFKYKSNINLSNYINKNKFNFISRKNMFVMSEYDKEKTKKEFDTILTTIPDEYFVNLNLVQVYQTTSKPFIYIYQIEFN
jgi:hypothetical protein